MQESPIAGDADGGQGRRGGGSGLLRLLYPKRGERPPEGGEGLPKVMNFPNETSILADPTQSVRLQKPSFISYLLF